MTGPGSSRHGRRRIESATSGSGEVKFWAVQTKNTGQKVAGIIERLGGRGVERGTT